MSPRIAPHVSYALKSLVRPVVELAQELPLRAALTRSGGLQPLAVFLPCEGRVGAAHLRIYAVAEALRPFGWRCLVMPPTLRLHQRQRLLTRLAPDVLVMQGARHDLNRPALYPGSPIVYDVDDADFHLPHLEGPMRSAMSDVDAVIAGSRYIADWCRGEGASGVEVVWTGTPVSTRPRRAHQRRSPLIAWSQTRPQTYRREAELVRVVAARLAVRRPGVTLRLYDRQPGDDPSFANSFKAPGLTVEWVRSASYSEYLASFDDVSLGFAPLCPETPFNRGKSFGKVLAYLDREVPVLASDAGEHGAFFRPGLGVLSNDPDIWVSEADRLLGDAAGRARMAEAAHGAFEARLTTKAAAYQVDRILRRVAGLVSKPRKSA